MAGIGQLVGGQALRAVLRRIYYAWPLHNLERLALKHATDKSALHHYYTRRYEAHFKSRRFEKIKLLEIGVARGGSLRAWRDYFWRAEITGIDIKPECAQYAGGRVKVCIGSQDDETFIQQVITAHGPFDIVIDDGSHENPRTLKSFELLFSRVRPGGYYVIEDLHCSHDADPHFDNRRRDLLDLFDRLIDAVDLNADPDVLKTVNWGQNFERLSPAAINSLDEYARSIESIHFYQSMCFIHKRCE